MIKDILKLALVAFLLYAAASNTTPQTKFLPDCTATLHEWCSNVSTTHP